MKILFIKNKITYNISDDINKFKDWLKRKTPLVYEFDELETNVDVKLNENAGLPGQVGIGLVEASRFIPKLYTKQYDVVVFLYDITNYPDKNKTFVAKGYPFFNSKVICIESPINNYIESIDGLYRLLSHEIIHAFHAILKLKGVITEDTMDKYDGEMDIENGANRKRNLIMLAPHWDKFVEPIKKYKWFSIKEEEKNKLEPQVWEFLDEIRESFGFPIVITSGYRTPTENAKVGGSPNSAHLRHLACDIACTDPLKRKLLLKAILTHPKSCFLEIARKHLHIDFDTSIHKMGDIIVENDD